MNYEKKYKEALEKARQFSERPLEEDSSSIVEYIFPELKESEDERIRKALIRFHKSTIDVDGIKGEDIIAWLEKQGGITKLSEEEQNRFAKGVLSSCALSFIDYLNTHRYKDKMCLSNGECEDIENAFHNAMWDRLHRYYCKYIEKQGEKKPFDYENANIQQNDFAPKAITANRQLYNRAILKILSDYIEKYPDIRFGQMLYNLGVNPHFNEESRETYCNLNETINNLL